MLWVAVSDVVAHPRLQRKSPAISQARFQFAFEAQKHVSLGAPMIRLVSRRILNHAHANLAEILRPPQRLPSIASMFGYWNFTPVGSRESRGRHFHVPSIAALRESMRRCQLGT